MTESQGTSSAIHRIGRHDVSEDWPVTGETSRSFKAKLRNGFYATYMAGDVILDIGYRGASAAAVQVLPHAIGIDLDYPGYDGTVLPFPSGSVDAVFSSHMLEHVIDYVEAIRDWYRVLRPGGFIVCIVPHMFLYEKRWQLPSQWNPDHKRFYTPASLLREFEEALEPNTYRVRHLRDNDDGNDYSIGPENHASGAYEIELAIEKRDPPGWTLAGEPECQQQRPLAAARSLAGGSPNSVVPLSDRLDAAICDFGNMLNRLKAEHEETIASLRADFAVRSERQTNEMAALTLMVEESRAEFSQFDRTVEAALRKGWEEIQELKRRTHPKARPFLHFWRNSR